MADANPAPAADANPQGSSEPPVQLGSNEPSPIQQPSPDDATRKLQSHRDKLAAENQELNKRLSALENQFFGQSVQRTLNDFIEGNKEKYPDVEVDDLMLAEDEAHLEDAAKKAQAKYDRIRNNALQKVREVPEETMTAEEKAQALKALEGDFSEDGQSRFSKYLNITRTKTRK